MPDNNKTINPGGLRGPITRKTGDSTTGNAVRPLPKNFAGGKYSVGSSSRSQLTAQEFLAPMLVPQDKSSPVKPSQVLTLKTQPLSGASGSLTTTGPAYSSKQKQSFGPGKGKTGFGGGGSRSGGSQYDKTIHVEAQAAMVQYLRNLLSNQTMRIQFRTIFENIDRELARTNQLNPNVIDKKRKQYLGDKSKDTITDVCVPVVYPQTSTALAYLCGVFLTGVPIFEAVADPQFEEGAKQFNTIIEDHQVRFSWIKHLTIILYDALRYNLCCAEVTWVQVKTFTIAKDGKKDAPMGQANIESILYEGNHIKRIDLYNAFWDVRVHPSEVHIHGEFAGYTEILSRIRLVKELQDMGNAMNIKEALESFRGGVGGDIYYVPQVTEKLNIDPRQNEFNWTSWFVGSPDKQPINYKGVYERTVLYARIMPSDFGLNLPAGNTPQIWKMIIINGQVVVKAERMTNAHNFLPMVFGQPLEDGLDYQTKSFSENLTDIQTMASQLWNIRIAAARRNVSDRVLYDPTKVRPEDINNASPNAKIPVRPNSYGTAISNAVYPFPYNDQSSQGLVGDALRVVDLGRTLSGVNAPQEGTFIKGNRTAEEFNTVSQNSNARLQMMAQFLESQFFSVLKEIIKINILQYQQAATFYSPSTQGVVNVNPVQLRQMVMTYKMADGLLPVSKLVDTDFLQVILQSALSSPQVMAEIDPVGVLSYLASLKNVPDIANFRRQPQNVPTPQGSPAGPAGQNAASGSSANSPNAAAPPIPGAGNV